MKKIVSTVLALAMVLSLAGCAGGTDETTAAETTAAQTEAAEETTAAAEETTAAETTAAADETTAAEGETAESGAETAEVMTHEEYMAADLDSHVVVETYVQAKQSWWEHQATVYAQSEDGAYFLYNMACSEEDYDLLVPGTKIRVDGYKAEWSGEVEIIDATFEIIEGDTYIAEPLDVTEMLGTDELIDHQNELVSFTGMTVEAADDSGAAFLYNYDGSGAQGDDLYFNVSYNGETYTFTIESYLCDSSTEVYQAVEALEVGQTVDMEGFLYWYEGVNPHITSLTVAE